VANIGIVNTGSGNVTSLEAAIAAIGHRPRRLASADALREIDALVIPGQGRFGPVMQTLEANGWREALGAFRCSGKRLLGICVGMQIFFEASEEDRDARGLALLPGRITRLKSPKQPMMGWSSVQFRNAELQSSDAYFVNSFVMSDSDSAIASTEYGQRFVAAVQSENWIGCQFHPEKSGGYGRYLLSRWLAETAA
jgi:imidazole glycerol phosphate synthase glutamine amidotransferase subunit